MADKSKFARDNFIAKIVADPKQVPDALLLSGYLGASSEEKHTRLYFDAQLSNYVEIPDDGILHTQDNPSDTLGSSYVWIKKDAVLVHGKANAERVKAKFLEGPIVSDYMRAAASGLGTGTADSIIRCNETYKDFICGTTKRGWLCTIVQPPTEDPGCPSQIRWQCPPPPTPQCPTYSEGPAVCPTKICEVQMQNVAGQAQPLGYTIGGQCITLPPGCPNTINYPCNHTQVFDPNCNQTVVRCVTQYPLCGYTWKGAICPTHTPACFPSLNRICITQNPLCNIKTVTDPNCQEALTVVRCPIPTLTCPYGDLGAAGYPGMGY